MGALDPAVALGLEAILTGRCPGKELLNVLIFTSAKKQIIEQVKRKQKLDFNESLNCTRHCTFHLFHFHTTPYLYDVEGIFPRLQMKGIQRN